MLSSAMDAPGWREMALDSGAARTMGAMPEMCSLKDALLRKATDQAQARRAIVAHRAHNRAHGDLAVCLRFPHLAGGR